jgi:hypothetical protein
MHASAPDSCAADGGITACRAHFMVTPPAAFALQQPRWQVHHGMIATAHEWVWSLMLTDVPCCN